MDRLQEQYNKLIREHSFGDLHCHILPGIDDGAGNALVSMRMMEMEEKQGAHAIAFSPHFYADETDFNDFLKQREEAENKIKSALKWKCWAEIRLMPEILKIEIGRLALNSTYLLLEFPFQIKPLWGKTVIEELISNGFIPVLAHVERFPYMTILDMDHYKNMGCILQMNAGHIFRKPDKAKFLLKENIIDIIASDAHNITNRAPNLEDAYKKIIKEVGKEKAAALMDQSIEIFGA